MVTKEHKEIPLWQKLHRAYKRAGDTTRNFNPFLCSFVAKDGLKK
jgi:hypothetical protein